MSSNTDIFSAIDRGDSKAVAAILDEHPRRIRAISELREQPLHAAAYSGRQKIASLLLDRGANINAKSLRRSWTPIRYAVQRGHKTLITLFAKRDADLTLTDEDCRPPLWFAAATNNTPTVNLLLRYGAPVDLMSAVYLEGPGQVLSRLKQGEKFPKNPIFLQELALDAICNGSVELVEYILDLGADPSSIASNQSLLENAISYRATSIVRLLLDRGASIKCTSVPRGSILKYCTRASGGPAIRKLLVKAGAK